MAVASFFLPVVGVSASNRAVLRVSNGQKWPGSGFCTGTDEHAAWARIGGIWHGLGLFREEQHLQREQVRGGHWAVFILRLHR